MTPAPKALYIHIPFCDRICSYCDFPKLLLGCGYAERYMQSLFEEMDGLKADSLKSVFIGGGTPTALSDELLEKLFRYINTKFGTVEEFTCEANPESLTDAKVDLMVRYGVSRVSLGIQTFNPKLLKLLNRQHNDKDVANAVDILKSRALPVINLDFIYGLPGQTLEMFKEDVKTALRFKAQHVSFYPLQVERGTVLFNDGIKEADPELLAEEYEYLIRTLEAEGYRRYEISNFALPGCECLHNLTYWHSEDYLAVGLGATSKVGNLRIKRTLNIFKYMDGDYYDDCEEEDSEDAEFNFLMLNLRLSDGFERAVFEERFGTDFLIKYADTVERVKPFLKIDDVRISVRPEHLYVLDALLVELLHFKEKENAQFA